MIQRHCRRFLALAACTTATFALAAPGDLDTSYGQAGWVDTSANGLFTAMPDGRILQWWRVQASVTSAPTYQIVRLSTNGQRDGTWGAGNPVTIDVSSFLSAQGKSTCTYSSGDSVRTARDGTTAMLLNLQAASSINCITQLVVKLHADGSLDPSFGQGGFVNFSSALSTPQSFDHELIGPQDDGSILLGQYFSDDFGMEQTALRRISTDGSIQPAIKDVAYYFEGGIPAKVRTLANGKTVVADGNVHRLNADGTLDSSYGNAGRVTLSAGGILSHALASTAGISGRIDRIAAGDAVIADDGAVTLALTVSILPTDGAQLMHIALLTRVTASGQLDSSFGNGGVAVLDSKGTPWQDLAIESSVLGGLVVSSTGEITARGSVATASNVASPVGYGFLWRLTANGQLPANPGLRGMQLLEERRLSGYDTHAVTLLAAQQGHDVLVTNWSLVARLGGNASASPGMLTMADFYQVDEGQTARITVMRTAGSSGAVSMNYETSTAGTLFPATSGVDYVATSGRLDWADGEVGAKYIDISTKANSQQIGTVSVLVKFTSVGGGVLLMNSTGYTQVGILNTTPVAQPQPTPSPPVTTPTPAPTSSGTSGGGALDAWGLLMLGAMALGSRPRRPRV